jgi:hypothetical protein
MNNEKALLSLQILAMLFYFLTKLNNLVTFAQKTIYYFYID